MRFFDCLYLKVSKFYSKTEKHEINGFTGLTVLALMQSLNIFTLFNIYCILVQHKLSIPSWSLALLILALMFANGTRYYKITFSSLQEKWEQIGDRKRNRLNKLVSVYIVGSITICLIFVIYIGDKKY